MGRAITFWDVGVRSLFGDVVRAIAVGDVEGDSEALLQAVRCLGM